MKTKSLLLAAMTVVACPALAQYTWLTNVGGNWNDPTKWSPAGIPNGAGVTATVSQPNANISFNIDTTLASLTYQSLASTITSVNRTHNIGTWAQDMGTALFRNSTLTGTSFTIGGSGWLQSEGTSVYNTFVNNAHPFGFIRILGSSAGGSSNASFTTVDNSGDLWLDSIDLGWSATMSGVFNNLASGEIRTNVGTGGPRTINGTINNQGTLNFFAPTTMGTGSTLNLLSGTASASSGLQINDGTVIVTGGSVGGVSARGGVINFMAGATTTGSLNALGTVGLTGTVNTAMDLFVRGSNAGGSAILNAQGQSNAGDIRIDAIDGTWNSTLACGTGFTNLAGGVIRPKTGSGGSRFITGTLTNYGTLDGAEVEFRLTGGRLNMYGGTTFGTVSVLNSTLDFGPSPTGSALIDFLGSGTLMGTNISTVKITGSNIGGSGLAAGSGTVTNNGVVELTARDLAWNATFNGTMVNNGVLRTQTGTGGTRFLKGHFTNNASVVLLTGLTDDGGTFLMNGGSITGAGSLTVQGGDLQLFGGSSTNAISNANSDLMFLTGSTFAGTVRAQGNSTLSGRVNNTSTVEVRGATAFGGSSLNALGADNEGTIVLTSQDLAWNAELTGGLTNLAGGMVRTVAGTGGNRNLKLSLDNQGGSFEIQTTTGLGIAGSDHENNGDLRIDSTLNVTGDTFENGTLGTIHGTGTLNTNAIDLVNRGILTGGNSVGTLTIDGDVTNTSTGQVFTEIASLSSYDKVSIIGDLAIAGGTISVDLLGVYAPNIGDTFRVLTTTGARTGAFSGVTGDGNWAIQYGSNFVDIQAIDAVPEPASLALLTAGIAALARRRKRSA